VGRLSGLAVTALGVLYAIYLIESVLYTFLLTETLATYIGISVLGGIVWRRANRWGALASLVSALATNFLLYALTEQRLDYWDPNVFLASLFVGAASLVIVSLLTRPEPAPAMQAFYRRLDTSSDAGSEGPTAPLLLVNLLAPLDGAGAAGWRRAYREDLRGFALGWAIVVVLVTATAWMLMPRQV
jgi:Na+/proline symporter